MFSQQLKLPQAEKFCFSHNTRICQQEMQVFQRDPLLFPLFAECMRNTCYFFCLYLSNCTQNYLGVAFCRLLLLPSHPKVSLLMGLTFDVVLMPFSLDSAQFVVLRSNQFSKAVLNLQDYTWILQERSSSLAKLGEGRWCVLTWQAAKHCTATCLLPQVRWGRGLGGRESTACGFERKIV